jgi:hypothetical protein
MSYKTNLVHLLSKLYEGEALEQAEMSLVSLLEEFQSKFPQAWSYTLNEKSTVLISYGDSIKSESTRPLQALKQFIDNHGKGKINTIHLLPFFPFSSDDGFSVIDYLEVNPDCGTWEDIASLSESVDLAFDGVINHISSKSAWFKAYLSGMQPYKSFFIEASPEDDLSAVDYL